MCFFFSQLYKFLFFPQNMRNSKMCRYFSSPSSHSLFIELTELQQSFFYFYDPNVKPVDQVILQWSRKHSLLTKLFAKLSHIQQKCYQGLVSEKLVER